ncbi:hypothetical protein [Criblamydia sequanensis]|uniref:Uncharacterized protein n=1 Tax=Candidatus Criblamydia sequanensis CRIB-18 TaxID=1437425 RepID=A0A090D1P4_9BACT|nr:hypothetical protein [Criblamydia sequanensis]CDR33643.1 hypothetical protein CSEC_0814 [Criblamydia sequanensis CRIB-18]
MYVPGLTTESIIETYEGVSEKELPKRILELNEKGVYIESSEVEKGYASEGEAKGRSYKLIGRRYKRRASCAPEQTLALTEKLASSGLSISKATVSGQTIEFKIRNKRSGSQRFLEIVPKPEEADSDSAEKETNGPVTNERKANRLKRTFNFFIKVIKHDKNFEKEN